MEALVKRISRGIGKEPKLLIDIGAHMRDVPLPVLSRPEPGLAIAGFGKRDAPYDLGLPIVRSPDGVTLEALNDQHAFLRGELAVGDVVVCGISHPCTAFDKWPLLGVIDDDDVVVGTVDTRF
jgi:D-serine deaminase-like pyridoxal phosphate-dependent protein